MFCDHLAFYTLFLHMAIAPAVRVAVETELSHRNDTTTAIFAAIKNKDNAQIALASSDSFKT